MKKIILFFAAILPLMMDAQNAKNYQLTTSDWQVSYLWLHTKDPYLSPLNYKGNGMMLETREKRFLLDNSDCWISVLSSSIFFGTLLNPAQTASMMYAGGDVDYGVLYRIRLLKNLSLAGGLSADMDLGFKYLARNTNNPFNMDLALNLNAAAAAQWKIPLWQRVFLLELSVRSPLAGMMFVPQNGAPYYEMFSFNKGLKDAFHGSHLGNKYGYHTALRFDIPLNHWTIQISANSQYFKYKANNTVYRRQISGVSVGAKYSFYIFSGRKNLPPSNFLDTDK